MNNDLRTQGASSTPPPLPVSDDNYTSNGFVIACLAALVMVMAFALAVNWIPPDTGSESEGTTSGSGQISDDGESQPDAKSAGQRTVGTGTAADGVSNSPADRDESGLQGSTTLTSTPENEGYKPNDNKLGGANIAQAATTSDETELLQKPVSDIPAAAESFFTIGTLSQESDLKQQPAGDGEKTSAAFFGIEAKGKRFVYVVDVSSSMAGDKFEKARQELVDSINGLGRNQYFFAAFFNDVPHYQIPADRLILASPQNKKRIKDWTTRALPSGGTLPLEAVEYAIRLRPDSVFILSDGEFDPSEVANIKEANKDSQIPINTIGFQSHSFTLKQIAEENRGTYRFVP